MLYIIQLIKHLLLLCEDRLSSLESAGSCSLASDFDVFRLRCQSLGVKGAILPVSILLLPFDTCCAVSEQSAKSRLFPKEMQFSLVEQCRPSRATSSLSGCGIRSVHSPLSTTLWLWQDSTVLHLLAFACQRTSRARHAPLFGLLLSCSLVLKIQRFCFLSARSKPEKRLKMTNRRPCAFPRCKKA